MWLNVGVCVGGATAQNTISFISLSSPRISSVDAATIYDDGNSPTTASNWSILACILASSCVVRADCSVIEGTGYTEVGSMLKTRGLL